jgi:DNA (cytosine-5)-methyltransferase 1
MFPELRVIRRRKFEVSWGALHLTPSCPKGLLREGYFCVVGNGTPKGVREMGLPDYTADQTRAAMGCPWMTKAEICQAIPPAYGEYIGRAAIQHLRMQ